MGKRGPKPKTHITDKKQMRSMRLDYESNLVYEAMQMKGINMSAWLRDVLKKLKAEHNVEVPELQERETKA